MKRYVLALDLKDDPKLIRAYEEWHTRVWPEVLKSVRDSGIRKMEIFRAGNRLTMIIEASDSFTPESKARADRANPKVQEWEKLMWNYQQALPFAKPGEKWVAMKPIFAAPSTSKSRFKKLRRAGISKK
jgi:L-rhamnose mutarotase